MARVQEGAKWGNPAAVLRMTKEDKIKRIMELQFGDESNSGSSNILQSGARNIEGLSVDKLLALDDEAAEVYESIRKTSDDISKIAGNTSIPEWKIQRIKTHVFYHEHILSDRIGRFDPDIEIADAWKRLESGNYNQNDLDLLEHEYFESKFESFYETDYRTAHDKTVESGREWNPYKEVE